MSVWYSKAHGRWRYKFRFNSKPVSGDIIRPDGTSPPKRGGLTEARNIEKDIRSELRNNVKAALSAPRGRYTLAEAVAARVEAAKKRELRNLRMIKSRLRKIIAHFGADTALSSIGRAEINAFSTALIAEDKIIWKGGPRKATPETRADGMKPLAKPEKRSRSTANAILNELSATLRLAHKEEDRLTRRKLLETMPVIERFKLPKRVPNPIPDADIVKILDHAAAHLIDFLALCRLFGFREQEALHLERCWVRWQDDIIVIPAARAKSKNDEIIPIPDAGRAFIEVLCNEAEQAGQQRLVLYADPKTGKKRPVKSVRTAWERACDRAGLSGVYRKHGMRGRFITAIAETNSPEVTHRLARHVDYETTQGYINIVADPKRGHQRGEPPSASAIAIEFCTKSR